MKSEATRDLIQLLCIVVVFPALVGLALDHQVAILAWLRSPAAPWFMLAGVSLGVAVFVGVLIWGLRRPMVDCQRECCADWRRERGR